MLTSTRNDWGRLLAVGIAVATAGCHSHVQLQVPAPNAPPAERRAAYARLRPLSYTRTQHYSAHVTGSVATVSPTVMTTDYLQIASGERVYYAEDLLVAVPEGSPTAVAIEESESSRATAAILLGIGVGVMVAGGAMSALALASYDQEDGYDTTLLFGGLGVMVGGGIVWGISTFPRRDAEDEAASAFETYDASLQARLNLCARGSEHVGCEETGAPMAPLTPPSVVPAAAPPAAPTACVPDCRSGFVCAAGQCVSACNPPCPAGQQCTSGADGASCVPAP